MPKTFKGGIHPDDRKELAKDRHIEPFAAPSELVLYLSQHIGAPAKPVVEKGDGVRRAMEMAIRDSVTVSIAALTMGMFRFRFLDSRVLVLTSLGKTSE